MRILVTGFTPYKKKALELSINLQQSNTLLALGIKGVGSAEIEIGMELSYINN